MKKGIIIPILVVLALAIAALVWQLRQKTVENEEMVQLFEIEKEEMENEYSSFAVQYDELQVHISNDSLARQLEKEKLRTQQLLEELGQTKATNAAELTRLKKELATVRQVMRTYVAQIDSLDRINKQLEKENTKVKEQYRAATQTITVLTEAKEKAEEIVQLASQLDAVGVTAIPRNKRDKEEHKIKKVTSITVSFTLAKNITTKTGEKSIYVQLMKPDGEILKKNDSGTFSYEDTTLEYSMKKLIEYDGEQQEVSLYWPVEEFLYEGTYNVFVFADKVMIGEGYFELE